MIASKGKNQQKQMKLQVTQVLGFIQMLEHILPKNLRVEKREKYGRLNCFEVYVRSYKVFEN